MRANRFRSLTAIAVASTLALTACGGDNGDSEVQLVLGHAGSTDDLRQDAAELLKEIVEEESDGAITIGIHPSATLGTWEEMLESSQTGAVDFVIEGILSLEAYTDLAAIETIPFLYDSPEHFNEVWLGDLGAEMMEAITEDSGYEPLGLIYRGPRHLTTTNVEVETIDDLRGLTIRTPSTPTMLATWESLGARSEALPFDEVYSAMEQGVIDGQENPLETIYFNSFHEVSPNITTTAHVYGSYHFMTWSDAFENLDPEHQELIRDAADRVSEELSGQAMEADVELLDTLIEEGAQVHDIVDRDDWVEATQPVVENQNEQVQQWVEEIRGE